MKKEPWMTHVEKFNTGIYNQDIYVILADEEKIKELPNEPVVITIDENQSIITDMLLHHFKGLQTASEDGKLVIVIVENPAQSVAKTISVIAHEAFHAMAVTFESRGMQVESLYVDQEPAAYLLDFIVEKVTNIYFTHAKYKDFSNIL